MIDLHCHLLPGIDDGPDTLEQSINLASIAVSDGITHAIVTPHIHPGRWENEKHGIQQALRNLQSELEKQRINLKLGFAAEVRITDLLFSQLEKNQLPFYGQYRGKKGLLLEFPHSHIIPGSEKLMKWLRQNAIQPIIAHPERNKDIMRTPDLLKPLINEGCLIQVTAGSLTGNFGEKAQQIAEQLLMDDQITFVATDAHNAKARAPIMSKARSRIEYLVGADRAQQLVYENPMQLVKEQFPDLN